MSSVARVCSVEWCDKPLKARGYCGGHYSRHREGRPMDTPIRDRRGVQTCSAPGCERSHYAKGKCKAHYVRRTDDMRPVRGSGIESCEIDGCVRDRRVRGLCEFHHQRAKNGRDMHAPENYNHLPEGRNPCLISDCEEPLVSANRLCVNHSGISYRYKLSTVQVQQILLMACEICSEIPVVVDHDHECCGGSYTCGYCIRGILCLSCNSGLGMFRDDSVRLTAAIKYLSDNGIE